MALFAKAAYLTGTLLYAHCLCVLTAKDEVIRCYLTVYGTPISLFLYQKLHFACKKQMLGFNVTLSCKTGKTQHFVRLTQFENHWSNQ